MDSPVKPKRNSIHVDGSLRKKRKVDLSSNYPALVGSKQLLSISPPLKSPGLPLLLGVGDIGQLGLGPDITERSRPTRLTNDSLSALGRSEKDLESFAIQVCAGGMHTVLVTDNGRVITFGCNDEGALGRTVSPDNSATDIDDNSKRLTLLDVITDETHPAYVPLPLTPKIVMVSAGDSHTAALDSLGQVWIWGTFRGPGGPIGLTQAGEISMFPKRLLDYSSTVPHGHTVDGRSSSSTGSHLLPGMRVIKIASGQDHLVCLSEEGRLYTLGSAEQGQLGRIAERFSRDGGRSGINSLLYPSECRIRGTVRFCDAWAGGFATFARCQATGSIYACGLNNYGQLGLKKPSRRAQSLHNGASGLEDDDELGNGQDDNDDEDDAPIDAALVISDRNEADKSEAALVARQGPLIQFMLTRARAFDPTRGWRQFAISIHHTLALDNEGHVYALGRADYGRLGLGSAVVSSSASVSQPTRIRGLLDECTCTWIGSGEACSFAVDSAGVAYSWGIANSQQLGHGSIDDGDCTEPGIMTGKQLKDRFVSMIDAGGQHTVLLAHSSQSTLQETCQEDISMLNTPADAPMDVTGENPIPSKIDQLEKLVVTQCETEPSEKRPKLDHNCDPNSEPLLNPPVGSFPPTSRRNRRPSPCSVTLLSASVGSATDSTAGATINSVIHSSAVSDTSSVGSCGSVTSTSSQLNSAKSTDGGGSSRCSSFDTYSVQSSLPVGPATEEASIPSAGNGSLMLDPLSASLLVGARSVSHVGRIGLSATSRSCSSAQIRSAGMSICSTSSEPGLPTDAISLGSMTASPVDFTSGDLSSC